jgi:hypothetical protein
LAARIVSTVYFCGGGGGGGGGGFAAAGRGRAGAVLTGAGAPSLRRLADLTAAELAGAVSNGLRSVSMIEPSVAARLIFAASSGLTSKVTNVEGIALPSRAVSC